MRDTCPTDACPIGVRPWDPKEINIGGRARGGGRNNVDNRESRDMARSNRRNSGGNGRRIGAAGRRGWGGHFGCSPLVAWRGLRRMVGRGRPLVGLLAVDGLRGFGFLRVARGHWTPPGLGRVPVLLRGVRRLGSGARFGRRLGLCAEIVTNM